jgi:NADH-quinone oxidoreductase subunit M
MLEAIPVLSLITWIPLAGALVTMLLPLRNARALRWVAGLFTAVPLLLAVWLYADYNPLIGDKPYAEAYTWLTVPLNSEGAGGISSLELAFDYLMGVDGLSLPLALLTGIVSMMALLASVHIRKRWKTFYVLFLLLQTGMYGVFLTRDVVWFFIFFELTLIPAFFLIGIWGLEGREKAANRFLVYNGVGSALMLLAFLILVATAGFTATGAGGDALRFSGSYDVILANLTGSGPQTSLASDPLFQLTDGLKWAAFVLLVIAFGIKLPMFPFHTWMLRVHAEAPPSVVMVHAGVLLKMGAYGLIRFAAQLFPAELEASAQVLAVLGVVGILYGAILAFVQKEFRLLLAYSSVSHMGIVLLGVASLNDVGLTGAVFQAVSHGLIAALLFLIVGSLYERTGTTRIDELGGLAKSVPFMSGLLLVAGLATLGLPGLSGFVGEFLAFLGLFESMKVLTVFAVLGVLLSAAYVLRGVLAITFGPQSARYDGIKEARFVEALPMVALAALIVLLGVYPSLLTDPMQHSFEPLLEAFKTGVGG